MDLKLAFPLCLGLDSDHIWTYLQRGADDVDGSPSLNFVIGQKILEFVVSTI
jgi:hypothetical protein